MTLLVCKGNSQGRRHDGARRRRRFSVSSQARNQIRRGIKGGLMVGTGLQEAHRTATRIAGICSRKPLRSTFRWAVERSTLMTAAMVPATASHAVTRSSVSVIGVAGRSHRSKHSSVGVNATSRKNAHAANWMMRFAIALRISSAQFPRKERLARSRPFASRLRAEFRILEYLD